MLSSMNDVGTFYKAIIVCRVKYGVEMCKYRVSLRISTGD
jgi:hypothetical protein